MTERIWRLLFGFLCLIFLTFEWLNGLYALVIIAALEGVTNLRLPSILTKLNFLNKSSPLMVHDNLCLTPENRTPIPFSAQRAFRLTLSLALIIPLTFYPQILWFFPWLIGIMLAMSGITGVCPMMLLLQWLGFKSAD